MNFSTWKLRIECAREASTVVAGRQICPNSVRNAWHHDFSLPGFVQCHQPRHLSLTSPGLFFPTRRLEKNSPGLVSRNSPACSRVPGQHTLVAVPFESAGSTRLKRYKSLCIVLSFTKVAVSLQPDKPYGSKSGSVAHFQGNPFPRPPIILQTSPTCKFKKHRCASRDRKLWHVHPTTKHFHYSCKAKPFFLWL